MARITGLETRRAPWRVRLIFAAIRKRLGLVPESVRLRARVPGLLEAAAAMERFDNRPGTLPPRWKRLAMLKTAALTGCPF